MNNEKLDFEQIFIDFEELLSEMNLDIWDSTIYENRASFILSTSYLGYHDLEELVEFIGDEEHVNIEVSSTITTEKTFQVTSKTPRIKILIGDFL